MRKQLKRMLISMLAIFALVITVNVQADAAYPAYTKDEFGLVNVSGTSYTFGVYPNKSPEVGLRIEKASGSLVGEYLFGNYDGKLAYASATLPSATAYRYKVVPLDSDYMYYDSDWSTYRYFADTPKARLKTKSTRKGIYVTVKKVKNVSSYKVYVKTKSGYKLSKTIKIGSKKSYTSRVTKYVKSKKKNYLKIVPMVKDSKGTHKSELYQTGNIRTLR